MMKILTFKRLAFVVVLSIMICGCDHAAQNGSGKHAGTGASEFKITGVNNINNFLINDTERGGDIFFESDKKHSCQLYFIKSKFTQGYSVSAKYDPVNLTTNPNVDLICSIENQHFSLAGSKTNYIRMSIPKVADTAEVKLSFALSNISGKKKYERKDVVLLLDRDQTNSMH